MTFQQIETNNFGASRDIYDHSNPENFKFKAEPGINKEIVMMISGEKNEPDWMLKKRLKAFEIFEKKSMPNWGPDLKGLNLNEIIYFIKPNANKNSADWREVPDDIRKTYEKLGIPQAERNVLGGVGAQYESEVVYHNLKKNLRDKGVIFLDMDDAVREHPELVKEYFITKGGSSALHQFAALHRA